MNAIFYLLIPLVLFTILLYPLLRKFVSLSEIFIHKYIQQISASSQNLPQTNGDSIQSTLLNLKLLAYERITLLIERLKPDSLIPRTLSSELSCKDYQLLLLNEIRQEFEYNLSQQLYLSQNAWTITVNFKDHVVTLVNSAASECEASANANQLGQKILERYIHSDIHAEQMLQLIKEEVYKH